MEKHSRIQIIDACRGLSILLMVVYHFFYDLVSSGYVPVSVLYNPLVNSLEVFFASLFILMSGASTQFSHSNLKRAFKILAAAALISAVTWYYDPTDFIRFGILHFLGAAALLYALFPDFLDRLVQKIHPLIFLALFLVSKLLLDRPYPVAHLWALGIYTGSFASADYFPIFPWIFIYLFGIWFGKLVAAKKLPRWFYEFRCPFFASAGRKTLWIYLLHQPVLIGILELIKMIPNG